MSGHHASGGSSNWKLWILVGVLVVVIVALAFLCIHFVLGGSAPAASAPESTVNISAQIAAQDANGKDVTKNLAITEGTMTPETDDPNAQFMLIDIAWAGKKDPVFPMIVTISDQSFTNDDGLAVYHYANGQWTLMGTYLIKNNSVSFQADSFSPFAFQVISANPPAPTATPEPTAEPTATPEPTAEPTPTPVPVDYGKYDDEQEGIFLQMDELHKGKDYVIALIDTENEVDIPESDGVTFFGAEDDEKVYNAQILLHYDEEELTLVEAQVAQTKDGQYYILTPVVEGMLWNTEKEEYAYGADRFSLVNNGKYLNLDNPNENVVLDEDSGRTRWLYEEIERDGEDVYTLTYRANLDRFFVKEMEMTAAEAEESENGDEEEADAEETLTFTATATRKESMILHIFAIDTGEVETDVVSGTLVLTSTPAANAGLDATPVPTNTPGNSGGGSNLPQPVTPTAVPTTKPTTKPTTVPTAVPTDEPVPTDTPPVVTDKPSTNTSGTNTGGNTQTGSGTNT